jgi:hypothetical protein
VPPIGSTVDLRNARWTKTIGAPVLTAFSEDPDFDAAEHAFYYVRVIEIPTPRWTTYDAKRFGVKMGDEVPMTVDQPRLHLAHLVHPGEMKAGRQKAELTRQGRKSSLCDSDSTVAGQYLSAARRSPGGSKHALCE